MAMPTPRLIDEDTAAAYLGIGKTRFRDRWQRRELPQPHKDGRRLLWDIKLLDRYVDALSGLGEVKGSSWDDL
ncbi:helix-turn-helix transcriptional regulator [Sphingomonas nostoxanthinifaciens]|uniref:helix-turn-helix transcriptional regulator n=1 Tax=Sphingomonas nostoxanthinifaciens TaxID=2872652 RepID=UPI001CC1EDA4|nr:hypothetical protein [Sphingomonas nostoxanthinifaciens]UAK24213.1 hypothetical protein K8P63_18080 [Sphingomonas nostoxanthinifaciens]